MAHYLKINHMRRSDKQVYAVLKASDKPLSLDDLATQADYSRRNIERIISRLRKEKLVRGVKDERRTVYEPIS